MPEERCRLKRSHDEDARTAAQFVAEQAREYPPLLVWVEPDPAAVDLSGNTGRRLHSLPFGADFGERFAGMPLAEARLFWERAALHVVASEDEGCRWAKIEESDDGEGEEVMRDDGIEVLTVADRVRFGLPDEPALKLRAIQYLERGRLVGWRLVTGGR
jgi:hypothetical protein